MQRNVRLYDSEFVQISNIKRDIINKIDEYCKCNISSMDDYPNLKGNVYWLIKEESLYRVVFLIRYVNTSNFVKADNLEKKLLESSYINYIYIPHMIKNGEELEVTITIKSYLINLEKSYQSMQHRQCPECKLYNCGFYIMKQGNIERMIPHAIRTYK